jgi:hypothetical protein
MEGGVMRFRRAADERLTHVDERNWRGRLENLHAEHRTWDRVAAELGVSPATLRRYRAGGYKSRGVTKRLPPARLYPAISSALARDRKAAVRGADWRRLSINATWTIDGTYRRKQRMDLGAYMDAEDAAAFADAYVSGSDERMTAAVNYYLSDRYAPHLSGARLLDVESMEL